MNLKSRNDILWTGQTVFRERLFVLKFRSTPSPLTPKQHPPSTNTISSILLLMDWLLQKKKINNNNKKTNQINWAILFAALEKKCKKKNIFSQSCLYLGNATCNWNGETAKLRTLVKQNTHTHTPIDHIIELHGLVYAMLCYPRLEISPILYVLVNKQKWKLYAYRVYYHE